MTTTKPAAEAKAEQPTEVERSVKQTMPERNAVTQPLMTDRICRTNTVNDFVSVPSEWQACSDIGLQQAQPASSSYASIPAATAEQTRKTADAVKEKTLQYSAAAKEKAVQYGTVAKEKAVQYGAVAKDKAVQYGNAAKEQAVKLGTAAKEKAAEGVGKLQAASIKRVEKCSVTILTIVSFSSLLLIALAAFSPYCRIVYSADRATDMPLWKLILGGTYVMGNSNPLQFTLYAHPELLALLLIPLLVLIPLFFRKVKTRLWITSGTLVAVGLTTIIRNSVTLRTIKSIVSELSLEALDTHVKSMNSVVIKWVQSVVSGKLSFANTFTVTGRIGWGLIGLFGWLMLLMGLAGIAINLLRLFTKQEVEAADAAQIHLREDANHDPDDDDAVPELTEDTL